MCVRKISAQCVLQFTPSLAAGCVLHRPVSRVIHCSELYSGFLFTSSYTIGGRYNERSNQPFSWERRVRRKLNVISTRPTEWTLLPGRVRSPSQLQTPRDVLREVLGRAEAARRNGLSSNLAPRERGTPDGTREGRGTRYPQNRTPRKGYVRGDPSLRGRKRDRKTLSLGLRCGVVDRDLPRAPSVMILPQVHLRKPCYDFYFL